MYYSLKQKRIALYGYSTRFDRTNIILERLKKANIDVCAIIDNNAEAIGKSTITYSDFLNNISQEDKSAYAFLLCFQDANQHNAVAKALYADGFSNLVFLPFDINYELESQKKIRLFYNQLLYGEIQDCILPTYDELLRKPSNIIKDYGEFVSFWVEIDKLHVVNLTQESDIDENYPISQFSDICITEYSYYIELFYYIYKGGDIPKGYVANSARGRDISIFLENRKKLISEMDYRLKYDWEYFIDSPIFVEKRDYESYTVIDGLHRALFLWWNGYDRVPVVCKKWE